MGELQSPHPWLEAMTCQTCEGEIDFPDEYTELGVCRHCGVAFLVDSGADTRGRGGVGRSRSGRAS